MQIFVYILTIVVFAVLFIFRWRWAHTRRRSGMFALVLLAVVTGGQTISHLLRDSTSTVAIVLIGVMWLCVIGQGIDVLRQSAWRRSR